ncbi:MAG: hypothetical protein HY811_04540 [Planctomycetes bacterium]|nr:hypothetical protein [Planctomycetota bacterium]
MALNPGEVKTENIASEAVTTPKIGELQVTSSKLQDGSVKTEKLATGAVTGSKLADNAVTGSKLRDGAVKSEKIAAGAITTSKIGELQVTGSRIQDKAITTEKIAGSAITTEKIANGSVTPAKLSFTPPAVARPLVPPLVAAELGTNCVEEDKIAPNAVTVTKIADNAIETAKIKNQAVTGAKVKDYDIGYTQIASNSINREKIINGEVTSDKLAVNSVETDKIKDGAVTPAKLSFTPGGAQIVNFGQNLPVYQNAGSDDFGLQVDLSALVPDGAKAVFIELEHQAGEAMTFAAIASVGGPGNYYACRATLHAGTQADGYPSCNAGKVELAVKTPTRKVFVSAERNGITTTVNVYLLGWIA